MPYWILAVGHNGRIFLVGYKNTQAEADSYIYENLPGRGAEVYYLPTSDKGRAVQMLRYVETPKVGFENATRNFRHSKEVV